MKIGVIAALAAEAERIISVMEDARVETVPSLTFTSGRIGKTEVVCTVCGVGKVYAAAAAEAMILKYAPDLVVNTGVGGTLTDKLTIGDVAVASAVCQHDFDCTAIGEPLGCVNVPGADGPFIPADAKTVENIVGIAGRMGIRTHVGPIASGDQFIGDREKKNFIVKTFSAVACEMEGGAIGQVCAANGVPFCVIRAISDSADGDAPEDFPAFVKKSAEVSANIVTELAREL